MRGFLALAFAATGVVLLLSTRLAALEGRTLLPPDTESTPLVGRHAARMVALGYTDFAADLAWVQAVLYYGAHWERSTGVKWLSHYIENTINLDPSFRRIYQWAGVVVMYNATRITNRDVETSSYFLKRGFERFPTFWEFPFMVGANYYFEMQSADPEQRKRWQRIGTEWFRTASLLPGAPPWLALLAISALDRHVERELAIAHLTELLDATEDPKLRKDLEHRLAMLEDESRVHARLRFDAAFRRAHLAAMPWAPSALYALTGARGEAGGVTLRARWEALGPPLPAPE